MNPRLSLLTILLLGACGQPGPVADNAAMPPDNMVGDASATGLSDPANAGSAEAADRAALPPPTDGLGWFAADDGRTLRYGARASEAQLTIACDPAAAAVVITRHDPAPPGGTATLSLTGAGHVASIPVAAVATSIGPGRAEWQGRAVGDNAKAMARPFRVAGPVQITIGGAPDLVVPASAAVRAVFAACS